MAVSVVINTLNEAANLPRALKSIEKFADEVVVVDMFSDDDTAKIAQKHGAKVYTHPRVNYVEPARNYAISKATNEWILILDADEELSPSLGARLTEFTNQAEVTYVRIPRKNLVFNKWIQHSRWWPDYNIRFFKAGAVTWEDAIHSVPLTRGQGLDLPAQEDLAIIHHHYQSIFQYLERQNRYSDQLIKPLIEQRYKFDWTDLITKPTNEFLSRYFAGEGYKDGLHGLALAMLQAGTELFTYLKLWEYYKFSQQPIGINQLEEVVKKNTKDVFWWIADYHKKNSHGWSALVWKIRRLFV